MSAPLDVDVAVLGGGPGGLAAAVAAARAGVAVALVSDGPVGGRAAHATMLPWRALERAVDGASDGGEGEAWASARAEATRLAERWEERLRLRLQDAGVEIVAGRGRFEDARALSVADGPRVRFDRAVVAVGAPPDALPGAPPDGDRLLRPDQLLRLEALPDELMVIGGGAAGAELVDALSRLGRTKLTWVMDEVGILPRFERELAEAVGDVLMERGVKLVHGKAVASVAIVDDQVQAKLDGGRTYAAARAVVCAGARPALDGLGLDALGAKVDRRGALVVDAHGRTSVDHVFAVGDCTLRSENVAGAEAMGRVAGRAAAELEPRDFDPRAIPRVAWTRPCVAQVGQTPERVAGREVIFHTLRLEETSFGLLRGIAETDHAKGFVRVVADSETGRLMGASALGPGAAEIVGAVAVALRVGATDDQLADVFGAAPSALDALGRSAR
ncbi:MAG TPA: FAD-dependent oxidoreductase [Sandaracinaceae bacterium LLY-WYZ-13_1]|nr:FAD-dependent oxidoreductase [Sandaracinaceae bacterium LLY-WYZ-13_1]